MVTVVSATRASRNSSAVTWLNMVDSMAEVRGLLVLAIVMVEDGLLKVGDERE